MKFQGCEEQGARFLLTSQQIAFPSVSNGGRGPRVVSSRQDPPAEKLSKLCIDWFILLMAEISEIRRSPGEVGSFSHCLRRVLYIPGGCLGFLLSTVGIPLFCGQQSGLEDLCRQTGLANRVSFLYVFWHIIVCIINLC